MPIRNYGTGDRMQWIDPCSCGRSDKRFKLLGRIDNIIQIWSCRLRLEDIQNALTELSNGLHTFQVILTENRDGHEKMELCYELADESLDHGTLAEAIYNKGRDLRDTISLEQFKENFSSKRVNEVPRNPRTGKISLILDKR
jgi:phenylacetate-coenzyme A ligase PaaK-like adenylate-forming protein